MANTSNISLGIFRFFVRICPYPVPNTPIFHLSLWLLFSSSCGSFLGEYRQFSDWRRDLHCKKEWAVFPSPAGMSLIKLFLGGNNLVFSRPERVWSVTSRLGTGKWLTLFYSVAECFERLTANAEIETVYGFDPSILRHSGIWRAENEAVLQKVLYNEKPRKSPLIFRKNCSLFNLRVDYCLEPALADCNMSAVVWGNSPHQTKILWDFPLKGKHKPLTESIPFYKNPFIPLSDQPGEWGGILTLKVVCRKI